MDGYDVGHLDSMHLKQSITLIPQYPNLLKGTLLDNLRWSAPLSSMESIKSCLSIVDLWDTIETFSEGLLSQVDALSGEQLSIDFKYRMSLAQGLLKSSEIIFIDELPGALKQTPVEMLLKQLVLHWKKNKTLILITDNESLLRLMDQRLSLDTMNKSSSINAQLALQ